MQHYYQFQVLIKPSPDNAQELYLGSLAAIGLDPNDHDVRFVEDDWESPTLGAWGLGWEVWLNGMEVTQFTYFQQVGGYRVSTPCPSRSPTAWSASPCTSRASTSVYDIGVELRGADGTPMHLRRRVPGERARVQCLQLRGGQHRVPASGVRPTTRPSATALPGGASCRCRPTTAVLKCCHAFNLLDARGVMSATERMATTSCASAPSPRRAARPTWPRSPESTRMPTRKARWRKPWQTLRTFAV